MIGYVRNARHWSNGEIKRAISPLEGVDSVLNVSGFDDRDKQGGVYRDYFHFAGSYSLSYYPSDVCKGRADISNNNKIQVDLMKSLSDELLSRFDLVFNHTVLEHVKNPFVAYSNIVKMSNDLVLTVVPFRQQFHFIPGQFGDYFRITPMGMRLLNELNGMTELFESTTPSPAGEIYIVSLATKLPEAHLGYPRELPDLDALNNRAGRQSFKDSLTHVVHSSVTKIKNIFGGKD